MVINIHTLGNIHSHIVSARWMTNCDKLLFSHLSRLDRHIGQILLKGALVNEKWEQILDGSTEIVIDIAHVL